jgi:hypothetical protein
VLVDVVAVLVVPMTVVQVVQVVAVGDRRATVAGLVGTLVGIVDRLLRVVLSVVDVVRVVTVLDHLATVAGQVLVVGDVGVLRHGRSSGVGATVHARPQAAGRQVPGA